MLLTKSSIKTLLGIALCSAMAVVLLWYLQRQSDFNRVVKLLPAIKVAASESSVDPYLLAGLVYAESRGQADALSSVNASGYCQLLPTTAAEVAGKMQISGPPYSPQDNLRMGAFYLAQMIRQNNDDTVLGLLSYRLGATRVKRNIAKHGGVEEYLASMRGRPKTPLSYVEQIIEHQQKFSQHDQTL